jgi:hypothetical protein
MNCIKATLPQDVWDKIPVAERSKVQDWLREVEEKLYEEYIRQTRNLLLYGCSELPSDVPERLK